MAGTNGTWPTDAGSSLLTWVQVPTQRKSEKEFINQRPEKFFSCGDHDAVDNVIPLMLAESQEHRRH